VRVGETDTDYFFQLKGDAISASRHRYRRFLQGSVAVEFS